MRMVSVSGAGVLSFDQFTMPLPERVTVVVGPNGAGKSNLARLLTICQRAIDSGDERPGDVDRLLTSFLMARHVNSPTSELEARVGIELTDSVERELVTEFVRAMVTGAIFDRQYPQNAADIEEWAEAEITETALAELMTGEIITRHPGTADGRWECAYEFTASGHDGQEHRYRWILVGGHPGAIVAAEAPTNVAGSDVVTRIIGPGEPTPDGRAPDPGSFQLRALLPHPDLLTTNCAYQVSGRPSASQRRFAAIAGIPLVGTNRRVSLATALRVILRRALVQTTDLRLVPGGGVSWSSSESALRPGAEARLPDFLLRLKNGDPAERARYERIQDLFTEFTQGRQCEVRLVDGYPNGEGTEAVAMPAIWVSITANADRTSPRPEVPIEFAGAGAWEALVLASALGEPAASVVVLDEPAVALHPSLQRQLGAYLVDTDAQFLVITHSAELMPLTVTPDVQLVRLDRDETSATRAWLVAPACHAAMTKKLVAKGNERLPFAWRAILCEGQDDVAAVTALANRIGIDLRRRNIAVIDCGSRDNLSGYIWFCAELGLTYLAVMDGDASKPDAAPKAEAVRNAVERHQGGQLVEFPENLETTFGVIKQRPSVVPAAIAALAFDGDMPDPKQAPHEVVSLAGAIRDLANHQLTAR